jgi:hypothetical protein
VIVAAPRAALPAELPDPDRSAEDARRAADEVLSDPAFDRPAPGVLARARDWVFDRIDEVLQAILGSGGGGVVGWVVVGVLVVAAVLLAVRLTRGVQREPGAVVATPGGPARPATDWLAEAARLESAGDWRGGLRCRHRALVASLAARGLVEEVPGRTTGEYRVEVARRAPAVAPDFDGATSLFELAWYGGRPMGADDAGRFADLSERVLVGSGRS